jgi:hypothetical protein
MIEHGWQHGHGKLPSGRILPGADFISEFGVRREIDWRGEFRFPLHAPWRSRIDPGVSALFLAR